MKLRIFTLLTFLAIASTVATAQDEKKGEVTFTNTAHDFGTIKEEDGNASYKFEFKNTGNAPVIITNVAASCGCTTPDWTKDPVLPGKTGFIMATFAAAGRPGPFQKSLTVMNNGKEGTIVLTIKGEVTPKVAKPQEAK